MTKDLNLSTTGHYTIVFGQFKKIPSIKSEVGIAERTNMYGWVCFNKRICIRENCGV
jgi:hypothetical protein